MERQNSSLFQRLIAAAVSAGMLASLAACANPPAETAAPKEPVTAEKAITELHRQSEALGFDNALEELEEKNTATIGGDTYIRLQQYYEGIPVYGKTIVYAANEDGQMTSVTGNVQDIDPDIDLTSTITPGQAQESIRAYAAEVLGMEQAAALTLEELSWSDACIYTQSGSPVLAYAVTIGADRVILDAHNGDILDWNCIIMADEIQYTGPEGTRSVAGAEPIDGSYILKDSQRNIYVYDAQGQTYWYPGTTTTPGAMFPDIPVLVQSPDTEFGDGDDNTASSGQAYTFLTELGNVYDFFAEMGEPGVGTFVGICNDLMNNPNDPSQGYFGENGGGYCGPLDGIIEEPLPDNDTPLDEITSAVVIIGSAYTANLDDYYDLFGHEYQHTVFQKHVGQSDDDGESGAINEGIADIMGELYESSRRNADWENGNRIIHDPSQAELPASVSDIRFNSNGDIPFRRKDGTRTATDFSHGCSTIISHSAYLMWNGIDGTESKKLSEQQLAELWYRAVLMMPLDCDFILCRQLVEVAAQSMEGLTDQQRECVREAFDRVGIASSRGDDFHADYLLAEDATLTVYDQNNEPYSGYTLRISGSIDMKEIASNMTPDIGWVVNRTVTVEEAGAYALDLPQGLYTLTITDPHYDEAYTIYVAISDEYAETNIDLITAYEEPLVVVVPENDHENPVSDAYKVTEIREYRESGELYATYEYSYNENGQITAFTVSGPYADSTENSTYSYDSEGRLLEGNGNKYFYNEKGQVESADLAFGQGNYEYDDQGRLLKSIEQYDMESEVAEYFYDDNGTLTKKVEYCYPVGSMNKKTTLNIEDAQVVTYTYDYDNQNRVIAERWFSDGATHCITYDYSHKPFTITTQTLNGQNSSISATIKDSNGNGYGGIYLSHDFYGSTYTPAQQPELFVNESGYLIKAIGYDWNYQGIPQKRIFEFSYSNGSSEDIDLIDTSNLQDALLNYWWENNIQCPCAYRFLADGSLLEYFEVGSDYVSRSLKYKLNGNTVSIGDESGYYTELELVYPTDRIAWDQGVGHNFTELPDSQGFLYEVGFIETDSPENAMYLIPTLKISAGDQ